MPSNQKTSADGLTQIDETTHLCLIETAKYNSHVREMEKRKLGRTITRQYPYIKPERFKENSIETANEATFNEVFVQNISKTIPIHHNNNKAWLKRTDLEKATEQIKHEYQLAKTEREQRMARWQEDVRNQKPILQYIGEHGRLPWPYSIAISTSEGKLKSLILYEMGQRYRSMLGISSYILDFRKYHGTPIETLMQTEEFKQDITANLRNLIKLHKKLCGKKPSSPTPKKAANQQPPDDQLKENLLNITGKLPTPYGLELEVHNGILTQIRIYETDAQGRDFIGLGRPSYTLEFQKYKGKPAKSLLKSKKFREDVTTNLREYLAAHGRLSGRGGQP